MYMGGLAHAIGIVDIFFGWGDSLAWFTIGVLWYILASLE